MDVVEFSYFGAPEPAPKEQLYTEIVDDLRGSDPFVGSGSQVFPSYGWFLFLYHLSCRSVPINLFVFLAHFIMVIVSWCEVLSLVHQ